MPNFDNYPGIPPVEGYAHGTVSVTTTATLVCEPSGVNSVLVQNNTGTAVTVYLGGSGVTASGATAGYVLTQNSSVLIPAVAGAQCALYAITSSGTASITYLYAM